MNRRFAWPLLMGALAFGLAACVVTPPRVTLTPPVVVGVAPVAPPPMPVEVVPMNPGPGFFWVAGYWRWDGRQHLWARGHWERHREREQWVPHRWAPDGHGRWALHDGYWRPD